MSKVIGGLSGFHSVQFYSSTTTAKASRDKAGRIHVEITPTSHNSALLNSVLSQLPFIRGVWFIVEILLLKWKLYVLMFGLMFILLTVFGSAADSNAGAPYSNNFFFLFFSFPYHYYFLLGGLLCIATAVKFTELGKYHSAEHMVDNAYKASQDLSLNNVRKYSRIHEHCGTNFITFVLIFYCVFFSFLETSWFIGILSFSFGYETYRVDRGWIRKILTPIYALGYFLQWFLFTSEPQIKHLEVSIAAYRELIKHDSLDEAATHKT